MKIKMTLLLIFFDGRYSQVDPNHLSLVVEDMKPPSKYIVGDIDGNLRTLFERYLKVDYDWAKPRIQLKDFRRTTDYEVVYTCLLPYSDSWIKRGQKVTMGDLTKSELKMEDYYVRIAGRR